MTAPTSVSSYGGKSGKTTDDMLDVIHELTTRRDNTLAELKHQLWLDPTLDLFVAIITDTLNGKVKGDK